MSAFDWLLKVELSGALAMEKKRGAVSANDRNVFLDNGNAQGVKSVIKR